MATNSSDDNNRVLEPPSSLHTKLQAIVGDIYNSGHNDDDLEFYGDFDDIIAQILQAFESEGYIQAPELSGRMFYDRFKAELPQEFDGKSDNGDESWYWQSSVLEAARRAAGVSDE